MASTVESHIHERRHLPERRSGSHSVRAGRLNAVDWVSMALLIVGGVNWGLVGLFNVDLVATLFGEMSFLSRIVYALVGLSALYAIYTSSKMSRS